MIYLVKCWFPKRIYIYICTPRCSRIGNSLVTQLDEARSRPPMDNLRYPALFSAGYIIVFSPPCTAKCQATWMNVVQSTYRTIHPNLIPVFFCAHVVRLSTAGLIWHSRPLKAIRQWTANLPVASLDPAAFASHGPWATRLSHRCFHWSTRSPTRRAWEHGLYHSE